MQYSRYIAPVGLDRSTAAVDIFRIRCHRPNRMHTSLIVIFTLATVFRVEAQPMQELVYDPIRYPYFTTVDEFPAGTVVKIPGIITAFTAYSWKQLDTSFGYSFAISENKTFLVQLQVATFAREQNAIFCSLGTSSSLFHIEDVGPIISGSSADRFHWRAPCKPARVPLRGSAASCALVLTDRGDLQLVDVVANIIIWRSNTSGVLTGERSSNATVDGTGGMTSSADRQCDVTVDDGGNLSLVTAEDNRTFWTSAKNETAGYDPECLSGSAENLSARLRVLEFPGGVRCFLLTFFTSAAAFLLTSL